MIWAYEWHNIRYYHIKPTFARSIHSRIYSRHKLTYLSANECQLLLICWSDGETAFKYSRLNWIKIRIGPISFQIQKVLSEFLIISCGLHSMMTVSRMGHLEMEFGNVEWTNNVSFATQSTPALSILIGRNPDEWEMIFKTSCIPELLVNPVKRIFPVSESTLELSWQLSGPRKIPFFKSFLFSSHRLNVHFVKVVRRNPNEIYDLLTWINVNLWLGAYWSFGVFV